MAARLVSSFTYRRMCVAAQAAPLPFTITPLLSTFSRQPLQQCQSYYVSHRNSRCHSSGPSNSTAATLSALKVHLAEMRSNHREPFDIVSATDAEEKVRSFIEQTATDADESVDRACFHMLLDIAGLAGDFTTADNAIALMKDHVGEADVKAYQLLLEAHWRSSQFDGDRARRRLSQMLEDVPDVDRDIWVDLRCLTDTRAALKEEGVSDLATPYANRVAADLTPFVRPAAANEFDRLMHRKAD